MSENAFTSDAFSTYLSNRRSLRLQMMKSTSFCLAKSMKRSPTIFSKPYPNLRWRHSCKPNDLGIVKKISRPVLIADLVSRYFEVVSQPTKSGPFSCTTENTSPVASYLGCHKSAWNPTRGGWLWFPGCSVTGYTWTSIFFTWPDLAWKIQNGQTKQEVFCIYVVPFKATG